MHHKIELNTFGMGDRFGHQGEAQLQAILNAREAGIEFNSTWNKSFRDERHILPIFGA